MRILPIAIIVIGLVIWLFIPAKEKQERFVPNAGDGDVTPTMATTDVSTLISDSGYTKYHIIAPLWQMFEDAQEPFWRFPNGLELEQYDLAMNVESTVVCDSAVYFSRKRIWRLDGDVVMVNTQADSFLTQQLFWDQVERKIYSDSFIHIVRTDRTIEGYGFESDQSMLYYTVNRPTAILPANHRPGEGRNAAKSDTVAAPAQARSVQSEPAGAKDLQRRVASQQATSQRPGDSTATRNTSGKIKPQKIDNR